MFLDTAAEITNLKDRRIGMVWLAAHCPCIQGFDSMHLAGFVQFVECSVYSGRCGHPVLAKRLQDFIGGEWTSLPPEKFEHPVRMCETQ